MFGVYADRLPIGAETVAGLSSQSVAFPYDGSVIGEAAVGTVEVAEQALTEGLGVRRAAAALSGAARRSICLAVQHEIVEHRDELIDLLIGETGKPRVDCTVEVDRTIFTWAAAADEVGRIHGETVPLDMNPSGAGLIGYWTRRPIGLVIGIAGFNYPLMLASHKIAPAVAAGCPIICKPAPATPLATLWLGDIVRRALVAQGAPAAMVQVITGDVEVGHRLVTDPRIGAVSFTGSAAVGHQIARDAAPRKALLELGSNAALVVAADADLDAAVDATLRGGFYANGQACISVQRLIVVAEVAEAFTAKLLDRLGEVEVGDPRDPQTRVAALINPAATERVLAWIDAAERAGATKLIGGERRDAAITPTVLVNVPTDTDAWGEEIFGPVVCLRTVPDLQAGLDLVNDSRFGLHASVFTNSLGAAFAAIDQLEVGGVVVNEVPGFRSDIMPYGGVKDSGVGREGPRFAIDEMTVTRMSIIRPGQVPTPAAPGESS